VHEPQKVGDMHFVRQDMAVEWQANVVQSQPQVILRRNTVRPLDVEFVAKQRHDVAGASACDGFMQAGERADVNHGSYRGSRSALHRHER
jgi:hypothetical protein